MFWKWGRRRSDPAKRLAELRIDCAQCGQMHEGVFDIGAKYPDHYFSVPVEQREERVKAGSDLCVVDDEHFFVRAVLEIPIIGTDEIFAYGAWGSLSKENFETYVEHFDDRGEPEFGPFFSWLNTYPEGYPAVEESLAAEMIFRADGQRPLIVLEKSDHPLSREQRDGITVDRLLEIYAVHGHVS